LIGWAGYLYLGSWLLAQGLVSASWANLAGMGLAILALPIASVIISSVMLLILFCRQKLLNLDDDG